MLRKIRPEDIAAIVAAVAIIGAMALCLMMVLAPVWSNARFCF